MATVYCEADACYLCTSCDTDVHSANRLAQRHIRRPLTAAEAIIGYDFGEDAESELVPDILSASKVMLSAAKTQTSRLDAMKACAMAKDSLNDFATPLSFEDAAEIDFCDFSNLSGKMPPLDIEDDSVLQTCKAFGTSVTSELSWGSVAPDAVEMEHVVPDIGSVTMSPVSPVTSFSAKNDFMSETDLLGSQACKQPKMLSKMSKTSFASISNSAISTISACHETLAARHNSLTANISREQSNESGSLDMESNQAPQALSNVCSATKNTEHRRKLRLEALQRFRNKRANRSFTKKVRYECRKQLADSRPRVKGRFVKKSEMALYRKYGALYREHINELQGPVKTDDQCVPAI